MRGPLFTPTGNPRDRLAQFDMFHPSSLLGHVCWGSRGLAVFWRLQDLFSRWMAPLGYRPLRLPSLGLREPLAGLLNHRFDRVQEIVSPLDSDPMVLLPFSEGSFLHHAAYWRQKGDRRPNQEPFPPDRALLWSHCHIREQGEDLFNFHEYEKCELFSLHATPQEARAAWAALNRRLRLFCRQCLSLSPLFGIRPPIALFPHAHASFCVEVFLPQRPFSTLMVSHLMGKEFPSVMGFNDLPKPYFCSAGFSHKLILTLLLAFEDSWGFQLPEALAPVVGVIECAAGIWCRAAEMWGALAPRIEWLSAGEPSQSMVEKGALWALQIGQGEAWRLWSRKTPQHPSQEGRGLDRALAATLCVQGRHNAHLRDYSGRQILAAHQPISSLEKIRAVENAQEEVTNIILSCCNNSFCHRKLYQETSYLPKLIHPLPGFRPCLSCGGYGQRGMLLERSEIYTSFYRPPEGEPL